MDPVLDKEMKQNTETATESVLDRVIADLLNPRGQHGAGAEYLQIFLKDCLEMDNLDRKQSEQAIVTAEYAIDEERRIDLVIETGGHFIPIEVKLYAADQKSQCFDYYQFARRRDPQAKVYYLTLDGHRPGQDSITSGSQSVPEEDIICLSFREHILTWLRACKNCENTGMIPILEQFLQSIEQVSGYTSEKVRNMVIDELLMMNDAAIMLADKECRSQFVTQCVHKIEEMVERVLAIPE